MPAPVALIKDGWREAFAALVGSAREHVMVCAPFIKETELRWLLSQRHDEVRFTLLTNVRLDSVVAGSLDLSALSLAAAAGDDSEVVNLPRLHAKVYVADEQQALVTSANLTPAALGRNYEYGVMLSEHALVQRVTQDIAALGRVGNHLSAFDIDELVRTGDEVLSQQVQREQSVAPHAERAFRRVLRDAHYRFIAAQVGRRTANQLFGEAIRYVLRDGPLTTVEIGARVSLLFPDLCDDSEELVINGERFGKAWKHRLRNAQQHLKRTRTAMYDSRSREWRLVA